MNSPAVTDREIAGISRQVSSSSAQSQRLS
jgi:hypothetical protein